MTQLDVALVTGSSRGLGSCIARRLARDGFFVVVNANDDATARQGVVDAIEHEGGAAMGIAADITDETAAADLVSQVADLRGPITVLVLNATGPQPEAPMTSVGWADHLDQLRYFVKSPVVLGRAVVPGMRNRGWDGSSTSTPKWRTVHRSDGRLTPPPRARRLV